MQPARLKFIPLFYFIILACSFQAQELLNLEGAIQLGSSAPANPAPGTIKWNGNDFVAWNGINWISLTGNATVSEIFDIDSNAYRTIRIGDQVWMVDNLRVSKFRGGAMISEITDNGIWSGLNFTESPAWCWHNNDDTKNLPYGKLYNWYATQGDSLCPSRWSIPTEDDWMTLINYLSDSTTAGGKIKEAGTAHWLNPNFEASNESGFTALPGSNRSDTGSFGTLGLVGFYWSSQEDAANTAWSWFFFYDQATSNRDIFDKRYGFSVRCIKD